MTRRTAFPGVPRPPFRDHRLNGDANIAAVAGLIGDEARAAILLALGSGQRLPAGELAMRARVTPQTASSHLAKLVRGGLLIAERHGRMRCYRVSNPDVARAIEALAVIAPAQPTCALSESDRARALRAARTCYDHLAGRLGVTVFRALVECGALCDVDFIDRSVKKRRSALGTVALGANAAAVFARFQIDLDELQTAHREFSSACLDWTENEPHLGGSLGAALCSTLFARGWCRHRPDSRAVIVTEPGRRALAERLKIEV